MSWREIPCVGFKLDLKAPPLHLPPLPIYIPPSIHFLSLQQHHFTHLSQEQEHLKASAAKLTSSDSKSVWFVQVNCTMEFISMICLSFASLLFLFLLHSIRKSVAFGCGKLPLPPGTLGWPYIGETFQLYSQNPNVFFASKVKKWVQILSGFML